MNHAINNNDNFDFELGDILEVGRNKAKCNKVNTHIIKNRKTILNKKTEISNLLHILVNLLDGFKTSEGWQ